MNELNLEISKDPFFNNFIEKRNLSKSTKTVYMGRIRSYCDFLGKNPSELIQDAQKRKGMKVDELVNSYIEELKQTGKSPTTIVNNLDTVKAFYNEFQIDTNPIKNITIPEINKWGNNKIISRDQIKEVLELSSLRDKAIILLHLSSGMEARELRCLTYGDFINSISEYVDLNQGLLNFRKVADELFNIDNLVGTWKIKKGRTGRSYVTFNSHESSFAILNYLMDRERNNKYVHSLNDPLFVNSKNQALSKYAHGSIFKRANNRADLGYLTDKRRLFSSTMLRKYFRNHLQQLNVDDEIIDAFLGQNLDDNIDYHSDDEIRILKTTYLESVEGLTVRRKHKITESVTSKDYETLIKKLDKKDQELKEIKEHLNYLKQVINSKK